MGTWDIGVRAGYLNSPTKTTYGEALKLFTVLNGIGLSTGIGFPEDSMVHAEFDRVVVFAGVTAAVFEP